MVHQLTEFRMMSYDWNFHLIDISGINPHLSNEKRAQTVV